MSYLSREFAVCLVLSVALVYACLFVGVWQGQLASPEEVERTVEDVERRGSKPETKWLVVLMGRRIRWGEDEFDKEEFRQYLKLVLSAVVDEHKRMRKVCSARVFISSNSTVSSFTFNQPKNKLAST